MTSFPVAGSGNEVIQDGGRKRKGRHLAPPPQWGSKRPPQVLVHVISGAAILNPRWRRHKKRLEDLGTPVKSSERYGPIKNCPVDIWSYFFLLFYRLKKKHLIISLTQPFSKWLRELPACHYREVDQSARVNTMKRGVDFGKHLLYFFFGFYVFLGFF